MAPTQRCLLALPLAVLAATCTFLACSSPREAPTPPTARISDHVDVYHGVEVPDPYRWLEDPDSAETRAWIEAENAATFGYLGGISERDRIRRRLEELWNHERWSVPRRRGERLFYSKNDGLQDQSILYVSNLDGTEERQLLDPNAFSADRTVALAASVPGHAGELLAYAKSDGGSDWRTWHVRDVASGADHDDLVTRNKFGGLAWSGDMRGFYYTRYERPLDGSELRAKNAPPEICFHRLGTPEASDVLIVPRPEGEGISQGFSLTEDESAMVVSRREVSSRNNELYLLRLTARPGAGDAVGAGAALDEIPLAQGFDARYWPIGDDGTTLFVQTDLNAPNWRVVGIDMTNPARSWSEIVPERSDTIESVRSVGGHLFVEYLHDATSRVVVFDPSGEETGTVELPGLGSTSGFGGEPEHTSTFYSFTSFTRPTTIYRYDLADGASTVFREPTLEITPDAFVTRQVFATSADGTRIPMFVIHPRGMHFDGSRPVYLYGYGGFNISITPSFSVANLVWLEMGGILAVATLRGGGEYGAEWHEAGTKLQKQNVFDDFIGAAEYLLRNRYTVRRKLAIGGGSNGGLLVGACITQRPELYGAALPAVGVMDMLRYHQFTIGWAWAGDYGTSDDPDEFEALLAYSPLHNIEPGVAYPATMVTTADHDDRVVPAHSFKFAATLQAAQGGPEPILIRIETRAGHGAGKPTSKRIDEAADRWAFLARELDIDVPHEW